MTSASQSPLTIHLQHSAFGVWTASAVGNKWPIVYAPTRERVLEMAKRAFAPYAAGRPIEIRDETGVRA